MARARSAVIGARLLAEKEASHNADGTTEEQNSAASTNGQSALSSVKVETNAAVFDASRVFLKGNPLITTKEILCPNCHLPRLLYPLFGEGARPPPDSNREYCRKHPPVRMPGRDVHGNPFAVEKVTKKKKTQVSEKDTPASSPPSGTEPGSASNSFKQLPAQMHVPTTKCPNCPRYFLLTKSAQHLDRCLGISTRQSSRNRTPFDNNGVNTPTAASQASRKRARPDEEDSGVVKKRKDAALPVKFKTGKPAIPSKLKNGTTPDTVSPVSPPSTNSIKAAAKTKLNRPTKDPK